MTVFIFYSPILFQERRQL